MSRNEDMWTDHDGDEEEEDRWWSRPPWDHPKNHPMKPRLGLRHASPCRLASTRSQQPPRRLDRSP